MPRNWLPVRCGNVYCSPSCGSGCTKVAHDRAQREVALLVGQLGRDWTPHVWENMGWHFRVTKGCAAVWPSKDGSAIRGDYEIREWYATVSPQGRQFLRVAETPGEAMLAAHKAACEDMVAIATDLRALHMPAEGA